MKADCNILRNSDANFTMHREIVFFIAEIPGKIAETCGNIAEMFGPLTSHSFCRPTSQIYDQVFGSRLRDEWCEGRPEVHGYLG